MKYLFLVFALFVSLSFSLGHKSEKRERIYKSIECDSSYEKMNKEIPLTFKKSADLLIENQMFDQFEADLIFGFIKIGNFWRDKNKYAIIINKNEGAGFHVFRLTQNRWKEVYYHEDIDLANASYFESKFADYNFDGLIDLAFCISRSNGEGIETVLLWLKLPNGFKFINKFPNVGSPKIDTRKKLIRSLSACCAFSEISVQTFKWVDHDLTIIDSTYISDYTSGFKETEYYQLEHGKLILKKYTRSVNRHFIRKLINEYRKY